MGGLMETELFTWAINTGGTSVVILVGMWKLWNGTVKKVSQIKDTVIDIDKRLVRVETKLEVEE